MGGPGSGRAGIKRSTHLTVRLSPAEMATINQAARIAGHTTMSAWARRVLVWWAQEPRYRQISRFVVLPR